MNEAYFALRLAEELKLAQQSPTATERTVRLRACALLCCMMTMRMERRTRRMRRPPPS